MARTYGLGKRRAAKAERLFLCPRCATRVASEKEPSENVPLDRAFFRIMLDLVGAKPDVINATFEQLSRRRDDILYPPALTEGEILPPERRLKAAG